MIFPDPEDFAFARVRLGPRAGTKFDVLPAEVTSNPVTIRYALAVGQQWVMFENTRVVLIEKLREGCLFTKHPHPKIPEIIQIVLSGETQLKMASSIRDIDEEDAESSGVSIVDYPSNDLVSRLSYTKPVLTSGVVCSIHI